ncbi:restriction endonuclease subunit S [Streptomyces sp. NPDC046931]|uniref:restriction endonuclease subunit S n=1 Tax=Streptomyces sp. NPDC046931 TaxID=3154806 RepID=UPI00340BC16E
MDNVEPHTGRIIGYGRAGDIRSASPVVHRGYLLYGRLRPYLNKVTIADFEGICSGEFIVFPPSEAVNSRFLLHRLLSPDFVHYVMSKNPTGDRPRAHWEQFSDFPILLPPLAEQHRIVAELDRQIAHIEAGEASIAAAIGRQQSLNDSLLDRAILGLAHECHPGSLHDIQSKSSKKIDYTALRALPEGWNWRVAKDVCTVITSGSTPEASLMHDNFGDVPFLKVYNITKQGEVDFTIRPTFIDRETHEGQLKKSRAFPGDVLTNIVGPPLGKTAVVPKEHPEWNINQAIVAFRAGPELSPEWLRFVLRSPYVIGLLTKTARATAGQFNIALSTCRELPIPVPPREVQEAICGSLSRALGSFADLSESVTSLVEQAAELRGSLLAAAFAGQLVPQDPDDQSASVLLDRIRAGRSNTPALKRMPRQRRAPRKSAPRGQEELPQ